MSVRDEIRVRLRAAREARRPAHGQPPPRYDEVWAEGVAWLDELAGAPELAAAPERAPLELRFVVPGRPVAWARARSRGARRYLDREQVEYRRRVQWSAPRPRPTRPAPAG